MDMNIDTGGLSLVPNNTAEYVNPSLTQASLLLKKI
jgi:hypothetical protein